MWKIKWDVLCTYKVKNKWDGILFLSGSNKNTDNIKCWQGWEQWRDYTLKFMNISIGTSTYKKVWQYLLELYVYMWYNPAVSSKGIYPTEMGGGMYSEASKIIF